MPILESFTVRPTVFVTQAPEGRVLWLEVHIRTAGPAPSGGLVRVRGGDIDAQLTLEGLSPGEHRCRLPVPAPAGGHSVPVQAEIALGPERLQADTTVSFRPWELWIVQHTHTDIGYTDFQTYLYRRHADYIDQVLDYCTQTDAYPPEARFCWTCEVAWTVRNFLERRPQRAEEFFRRVRQGRIEVTGLYLQLTDLYTEELLVRAIRYATDLARTHGFEVVTAMNNDVNGWAWGLPQILAQAGIRYFDTAINETRSLAPRPRPRPLRWASPDGSAVLMWHGNHYMQANALRLHISADQAEPLVDAYLQDLAAGGYPDSVVELRGAGLSRDNAPPSRTMCDVVREWNRRWVWPRLRLVTSRQWFEHLESRYPGDIPTFRQGWPDWWADGNGSALAEVALVRQAQADLATVESLGAILRTRDSRFRYDADDVAHGLDRAMFFDEHTWGAYCSTTAPDSLDARGQWLHKASFAYEAADVPRRLRPEYLTRLVAPGASPDEEPLVLVFNPLPWPRCDVTEVLVPRELLPPETPLGLVDLQTGGPVASHEVADPDHGFFDQRGARLLRFLAADLPPMGYRVFRLVSPATAASSRVRIPEATTIENDFFRVRLDPDIGAIASLVDLAAGRELVDTAGAFGLNQHLYEQIDSPAGRDALARWGALGTQVPFRRWSPSVSRISVGPAEAFGRSLRVHLTSGPAVRWLQTEVILYDRLPRVDIVNRLNKIPLPEPEAIYHAFPFAMKHPTVHLDVPGGALRPGLDQVARTATDWHSIQDWFAVWDEDYGVTVASPDVPLVQCGGINTGRWAPEMPPANGLVMSWVMNNYWFTNFPASQGGIVRFRYSLSTHAGPMRPSLSARFGLEVRFPLVSVAWRTRPPQAPTGSFLELQADGVTPVAVKPADDGRGIILRLRERDGRPAQARIRLAGPGPLRAMRTTLNETDLEPLATTGGLLALPLKPYELVTLRLEPGS